MMDQHPVAGPGRLGDGPQAEAGDSPVQRDLDDRGERRGPGAVITLTLTQHGPLAGLVRALAGRLTRKNLALELDGFRRGATSAPG
jgi:hypothetical protein